MRFAIAAALAAALGVAICGFPAQAHEGHDHAEQAEPAPKLTSGNTRAEARSDALELVAVVRGAELSIYLDRFTTNEPVEGAVIEVETPAGPITALGQPGEAYRIAAPWLTEPGPVDLIATVTVGEATEIFPLTLVVGEPAVAKTAKAVPSGTASMEKAAAASPALLVILGVAGASFLLGLAVASRRRSRMAAAIVLLSLSSLYLAGAPAWAHEGEDHSQPVAVPATLARENAQRLPDGSVFVPKPTQRIFAVRTTRTEQSTHRRSIELPGRIIPDPNASGLVQAAVGGRLSPPPGGFPQLGAPVKAGTVLAYVTPPLQAIDVSDMRQRQGELDQQIAIVQLRLERYETLAPTAAISRVLLEESRLELQGLKDRRAALDRSNRDPEPLAAPVSGVVAEANAVAGQMAQPDSIVFRIVDPARLWVEALSFEQIPGALEASAKTSAGEDVRLSYRGSGYADRNQSAPIHFAIEGEPSGLRPGQFVTVLVTTDQEKKGIAIPRGSVVRSANGQTVVFEHTTAEMFEARPVRVEPLDGERVLVFSGLGPGQRVVTQGAELLDQVR